jgi:hypothetical protein
MCIGVHAAHGVWCLGLWSIWLLRSSRWQHGTFIRSFCFDPSWCLLWGFDESGAHCGGWNHHGRPRCSNSLVTCGDMTSHALHRSIQKLFLPLHVFKPSCKVQSGAFSAFLKQTKRQRDIHSRSTMTAATPRTSARQSNRLLVWRNESRSCFLVSPSPRTQSVQMAEQLVVDQDDSKECSSG